MGTPESKLCQRARERRRRRHRPTCRFFNQVRRHFDVHLASRSDLLSAVPLISFTLFFGGLGNVHLFRFLVDVSHAHLRCLFGLVACLVVDELARPGRTLV